MTESQPSELESGEITLPGPGIPTESFAGDDFQRWQQMFLEKALTYYTPSVSGHLGDPMWAYQDFSTTVLTDANGRPTRTATNKVLYGSQTTVLTDNLGRATGTMTYWVVPIEKTLYDADGHPTATSTIPITKIPAVHTLYDSNGDPTKTTTDYMVMPSMTKSGLPGAPTSTVDTSDRANENASHFSDAKYFAVLMLPTLLAIIVAIPIRILDRTVKRYQPFHAMVSGGGAPASECLCLETTGPWSFLNGLRAAIHGQVLLGLTSTLVLASAVLIPLSGEITHVAVDAPRCANATGNSDGVAAEECPMTLTVFPRTAGAVVGVLALMSVLVGAAVLVLRHWRTGVHRPWSLYYIANLATDADIQRLLRRFRERSNRAVSGENTTRAFRGMSFVLDYWRDNDVRKYGIQIATEIEGRKEGKIFGITRYGARRKTTAKANEKAVPFYLLTFTGRMALLSSLCVVLAFVLIYHITGQGRIGNIVMRESIGVRILFAILGVLVALTWDSFFYCKFKPLRPECDPFRATLSLMNASLAVAIMGPFRMLERQDPKSKREAVCLTPPTNAFSGIRSALFRRPRDYYLSAVSATGILADFLPLLLSSVAFESSHSYMGLQPCTWISIMILSMLIIVALASFLVKWPHMSVDPTTVAGAMYYASDPTLSTSVTGMSPSAGVLFGRVDNGAG